MADLTTIPRPENEQDEQHVVVRGWHMCPATRRKAEMFWPVGAAGSFHPNYTPFEVMSMPCESCDVVIECGFQWSGKLIIDLGAKPKGAK